ncbi:MAG TPA: phytanoyl-CoA dioxygenase family protein [Geminicoccaceae bacterium]
MRLSDAQIEQYHDQGWLFLPAVFGEDEAALMLDEAHRIYAMDRQEVVREKDGKTARTAFAAHKYDEVFARLAHHPRLIGPIEQILGDRLYVHQFKLNAKAAFDGDQWQWHQDFGVWHRDDGMPEPRAMNIAVFLDPVTEFNGPLMFIPESHKKGVLEAGHDTSTTSYPLWTLDHATVRKLADQFGLVAPKGPAGSVLMFHGCLAHASPGNISPYDRTISYVTFCAVENHITRFKRPEWIAHRDFTPIEPMADDCLAELVAAHRQAAE